MARVMWLLLVLRLAAVLEVEFSLGHEDLVSLSPANPVDGILFAELGDLLPPLFIDDSILCVEWTVVDALLDLHPFSSDLTHEEVLHADTVLHEGDLLCWVGLRAGIEVYDQGIVLHAKGREHIVLQVLRRAINVDTWGTIKELPLIAYSYLDRLPLLRLLAEETIDPAVWEVDEDLFGEQRVAEALLVGVADIAIDRTIRIFEGIEHTDGIGF